MGKGLVLAGVVGVAAIVLTVYPELVTKSVKPAPVVTIENGKLQGRMGLTRSGKEFAEYLSIPYAQPPIGDLRFESPVPVKPWEGVKMADKLAPYCAQMDSLLLGRAMGVEDCLYLNVFTSSEFTKNTRKRPVMVFIHGGGFLAGASQMYGPNYLMDEDIVFVTLNYRLGPFGFLNTGDDLIRGNMGLKDQRLALQWIKKNILRFGGDPTRITIFGESAGAASVHFHVISKASEGLFHRAITQSGSATCPWTLMPKAKEATFKYGEMIGCPTDNSAALVDCMKKMDWLDIVKPTADMMNPISGFDILKPSVETVIRDDTFLTEHPLESLTGGRFSKVPLMTGVTSGEGGIRSARLEAYPELLSEIDRNWETHAKGIILVEQDAKLEAQKLRDFYLGNKPFAENPQFMQQLTDMISDVAFNGPVQQAAKLHATHGGQTYFYLYDYASKTLPKFYTAFKAVRHDTWLPAEVKIGMAVAIDWINENIFGEKGPHAYGITHADDLPQLFTTDGVFFSESDLDFSQNLVKLFVDFARGIDPLKFKGVEWPSIKPHSEKSQPLKYMLLQEEPKVITDPFTKRMAFWESLNKS